ncbi:hypothetical protein J6590_019757 [Homalodisca vitripennis]|nr:hypothetical protein J6590_019757 [Homalodisca vitripennis]
MPVLVTYWLVEAESLNAPLWVLEHKRGARNAPQDIADGWSRAKVRIFSRVLPSNVSPIQANIRLSHRVFYKSAQADRVVYSYTTVQHWYR